MKVLINYIRLSNSKLLVKADNVVAGLTGNASFPDPTITPAALAAQILVLRDALIGASTGNKIKMVNAREQKELLANMLHKNAVYVNMKSSDEQQLISTGFTMTKHREKHGVPAAVRNLKAVYTNITGSIDLTWERSPFAKLYFVYISNDGGHTWTLFKTILGRKLLCESLTSNIRYQFKVVAANQVGQSIESEIATQIAA